MTQLSVLIPAHNEAAEISDCLAAVLNSTPLPKGVCAEILVLANGCTDETAEIARAVVGSGRWKITVLEQETGGKLAALTVGDRIAQGDVLVYLDADVRVSPDLLPQLYQSLAGDTPRYGSGGPVLAKNHSAFSNAYGRLWQNLPFYTTGVPGFGLFAMNRTGRTRWADWPDIIADDTFARLNFAPEERICVPATYSWPLVEGFRNLVRVRRRQNAGVAQLSANFPELFKNEDKHSPSATLLLKLLCQRPFAFLAYLVVSLAVKTPLFRSTNTWARGR